MSEKKVAQTKTIAIFERLQKNCNVSRMLSALTFNLKTKVFGTAWIEWHVEQATKVDIESAGILDSMSFYLSEIEKYLDNAETLLRESIRELEFREFREKAKK